MKIEKVLDGASVKYENGLLLISTGIMSRIWEWQGNGFATRETSHSGYDIKCTGSGSCDFNIFGLSANADAQLRGIDVQIIDDGLTSKHLEAAAIISYPVLFICVKYVIWVYPGAHGLRTQLYIKTFGDYKPATDYGESITETLVFPAVSGIKAAGYYNDTQHRNKADTEIIREESFVDPGSMVLDWANLVALFNSKGGMCVVKESNKCVNQNSYDTGAFIYENGLLKVSGAGLKPEDLREDRYLLAWASWTIFFDGTEDGLETAAKEFDRQRFPVNNSNDIYIMSNTWGTTNSILPRDTACAESVLKDIPVAAEIGVDVLQIDAGWNSPMGSEKKDNPDTAPWYTHKSKYPDGWDMVTKSAAEKGLVLGLWFPWMASADEIIDNMRLGNFRYFKIDYANLNSREYLDSLIDKAHKVYAAGGGKVRINWDVTENAPRMGFYFGKEFGNIYLANRKPEYPVNVVYVPYLVLRDAWQVAKYTNIYKFQIILQNLDLISRESSDAYLHNFSYCAMIAFMGSPILFQQVQYLSAAARLELREIIAVYKKHRQAMYRCFVYPIGNKPDNSSWTGFQFVNGSHGYIVLFRELNNNSKTEKIKLKAAPDCDIQTVNVITGKQQTIKTDNSCRSEFTISDPCSFLWYSY